MKTNFANQCENAASNLSDRDAQAIPKTSDTASFFKLRKILVPLDFSDCSKKAVQYAIPFAGQFKADIIFLHVLRPFYIIGSDFKAIDNESLTEAGLVQKANRQLTSLVRENIPVNIHASTEVRRGAPSIEIVNIAKDLGVDLIIMSTHGHTGRVHAFVGSVASDVTRLASCPVLVVREQEHDFVPCKSYPIQTPQPTARAVPAL